MWSRFNPPLIADEPRLELPYEVAGIPLGRLAQGFTGKHGVENSGIILVTCR